MENLNKFQKELIKEGYFDKNLKPTPKCPCRLLSILPVLTRSKDKLII